jgi:hypothetical protein
MSFADFDIYGPWQPSRIGQMLAGMVVDFPAVYGAVEPYQPTDIVDSFTDDVVLAVPRFWRWEAERLATWKMRCHHAFHDTLARLYRDSGYDQGAVRRIAYEGIQNGTAPELLIDQALRATRGTLRERDVRSILSEVWQRQHPPRRLKRRFR